MADNETTVTPEEQPQAAEEPVGRQRTSDSWVMVEEPEGSKPAAAET